MSQFFEVNPENPQERLIQQAGEIIRAGGVIVYPTDSGYALGCQLGDKAAMERISKIRNLAAKHKYTLLCRNLADLGKYARFDTPVFRILKANTPGPYTFVLNASRDVPKRLLHPKRRTIGLRIPENRIAQALLAELQEPMLTTSLILPEETFPLSDPLEIKEQLEKKVELIIDGGFCGTEPTTVVDLLEDVPKVLREGKGDVSPFL